MQNYIGLNFRDGLNFVTWEQGLSAWVWSLRDDSHWQKKLKTQINCKSVILQANVIFAVWVENHVRFSISLQYHWAVIFSSHPKLINYHPMYHSFGESKKPFKPSAALEMNFCNTNVPVTLPKLVESGIWWVRNRLVFARFRPVVHRLFGRQHRLDVPVGRRELSVVSHHLSEQRPKHLLRLRKTLVGSHLHFPWNRKITNR